MPFNPDSPATLGPQWLAAPGVTLLQSITDSIGIKHRSSAAETIDKCSVYLSALEGPPRLVVDVYKLASAVAGASRVDVFRPNEDVVKTNVDNQAGSTTSIFQAIDEVVLDPADYIDAPLFQSPSEYSCRFGVGVGNLTGRRITKVVLVWVANCNTLASVVQITPYANIGNARYNGSTRALGSTANQTFTDAWLYNPATGVPWTIADIEAFDTVDEFGWSIPVESRFSLVQAYLEIHSVPENREATGSVAVPVVGWNVVDLSSPTGATTWSKLTTPQDYLYVARLMDRASVPVQVPHMEALAAIPHASYESYLPVVQDQSGIITSIGAAGRRGYGLIITTSTPTTSADSQPHARARLEPVYSGRTVQQEIAGQAGTYGFVRALIAQQGNDADGALLIKVKRRSDNVQLGSTLTVPADLVREEPVTTPQVFEESLVSPATLVAGTQYYLEFSSTATSGKGWVVSVLDTEGQGSTLTFGGTTDVATVAGVEDVDMDACVTISTVPAAPTGFSAQVA